MVLNNLAFQCRLPPRRPSCQRACLNVPRMLEVLTSNLTASISTQETDVLFARYIGRWALTNPLTL